LEHLHRFDEALQQRIDAYKQIEAYLPKRCREQGSLAHKPFLLATVRLGLKNLEVYQQWCRDLISEVKQLSRS
jgi:hypothetical protein